MIIGQRLPSFGQKKVIQFQNWLIAAALFLSGANIIGLVFPFSVVVIVLFVLLSLDRPARFNWLQLLAVGCVWFAAIFGFLFAAEFSDLFANIRQMAATTVVLLLVGILRSRVEDVLEKYFTIFTIATGVGLLFYAFSPDVYFLTHSIGERSYLIGPSSKTLDSGFLAYAALGPYRFEGLFDEPGTFSVYSAAAAFWAYMRGRRFAFVMLIIATGLSEGVAGFIVLVVLFARHWLISFSMKGRFILLALTLFSFELIYYLDIDPLAYVIDTATLLENKTLSAGTRSGQLMDVINSWTSLIFPSGFSVAEVLKVSAGSITTGYVRSMIPFGLILWAVVILILLLGLARADTYRSSGILFWALVVSGTSRSAVFDLVIGWFVLFYVLGKYNNLLLRDRSKLSAEKVIQG